MENASTTFLNAASGPLVKDLSPAPRLMQRDPWTLTVMTTRLPATGRSEKAGISAVPPRRDLNTTRTPCKCGNQPDEDGQVCTPHLGVVDARPGGRT